MVFRRLENIKDDILKRLYIHAYHCQVLCPIHGIRYRPSVSANTGYYCRCYANIYKFVI
jgi:hypothetical protein